MELALELSRREAQSKKSPQKLRTQNKSSTESDGSSPHSEATHHSFGSTPFFNSGGAADSEDDEDDEDLQMALAYSLSELDAEQRAAVTDIIKGALGEGAMKSKAKVHKETTVTTKTKTKKVIMKDGKVVLEETQEDGPCETASGPAGRWETEGKGTREPDVSPESPSSSSTAPQSSAEDVDPPVKHNLGSAKKKKKCKCTVC